MIFQWLLARFSPSDIIVCLGQGELIYIYEFDNSTLNLDMILLNLSLKIQKEIVRLLFRSETTVC